jgi:hypothetical protein
VAGSAMESDAGTGQRDSRRSGSGSSGSRAGANEACQIGERVFLAENTVKNYRWREPEGRPTADGQLRGTRPFVLPLGTGRPCPDGWPNGDGGVSQLVRKPT